MNPEQIKLWKKDLLARLDALEALARNARKDLDRRGEDGLEDKAKIEETWTGILDLLPEGFHPTRSSDLSRHVAWGQRVDFWDIEKHDVPEVRKSIQRYGLDGEDLALEKIEEQPLDLDAFELVHPEIRDAVLKSFTDREYDVAARSAVEIVMDEVRRMSGSSRDGVRLLNDAFRGREPLLRFTEDTTDQDRQVSDAMRLILQALYTGIRNPIAHTWEGLSRFESFQVMVTASFVLNRLQISHDDPED